MRNKIKKNYSIYLNLFFFLFFYLFGIESALCEGKEIEFFQEENLSSNENFIDKENINISDKYKKALILSGFIILVSVCLFYLTGNGFNNDIDNINTVTNVIKDVQVSETRTVAERKAFMKAFHVGLQIPSWW